MDREEELAFRAKMEADPILQDKVAFAKLMMLGIEEANDKGNKNGKKSWLRWLLVLLVILALILLGIYMNSNSTNAKESETTTRHQVTDPAPIPNNLAIDQGGGTSNTISDRASSIIWNSLGEAVLCGQIKGPAILGNTELPAIGETDIFLASYSIGQGYLWARAFGSNEGISTANDIAVDGANNIVLTGSMFDKTTFNGRTFSAVGKSNVGKSDFYVAKFTPFGYLIWLDHGGGITTPNLQTGDNNGRSVAVNNRGEIIAVGDYIGSPKIGHFQLPSGGPNEDTYIAKYAPDGEVLWAKSITGNYMVSAYDVTTDRAGNIFVIGYFGHHNLGGKITLDNLQLESYGGRDIFVAKYSTKGDLLWADHAGSSGTGSSGGYDYAVDVAADNLGGCLVTGWFQGEARFGQHTLTSAGGRDIFNVKYTDEGKVSWASGTGGALDDQGSTVAIDQEGNCYSAGFFSGSAKFGDTQINSLGERDIFVAKHNPRGELIWLRQMGGNGELFSSEGATGMSINNIGQIVLTGYFSGRMQIGNQVLDSQGREDFFLIFFDENGDLIESRQFTL